MASRVGCRCPTSLPPTSISGSALHPRLSVSAVSSRKWSLDEDLRFWGEHGIDHVGLSFRKLEEAGLAAACARVRDAGLRVSNIVELGWWELDDSSTWPAQQQRLVNAVDAAATTGAPCLVVTSGPSGRLGWDEASDAFGAAVAPVRDLASAHGIAIALEHTGPLRVDLSFVTTLHDAVDVARAHDLAVCMEINSCFAERALLATVAAAGPFLRHVQLSDYVVGSLSTPDRAVPGDGDIPLERIIRGLVEQGYSGAFELELVGPRIEAEGYASAITRSVARLDALLGAAAGGA